MSKIHSERMKGRQLATAFGTFTFVADGIAEVPDEHVNKLLAIKGYKAVGTPQNEEETPDMETNPPEEEKTQNDDLNGAEDNQKDDDSEEEKTSDGDDSTEEKDSEEETDGDTEESEETPDKYTLEELEKIKNVQQLKKIAKDNNIDLNGATKRDEIIPIILGAMN